MNSKILTTVAVAASALALTACDVDKTEDGRLPDVDVSMEGGQLPKYDIDVRKTQDGKLPDVDVDADAGKLPAYSVRGPEVRIGTDEATVKVPDVDVDVSMEEKTLTVPDVDVKLPDEHDS